MIHEFLEFRANCGALWSYNWVSIPMVYTQVRRYFYNNKQINKIGCNKFTYVDIVPSQVCTLATYSYFIACLVARQYTGPSTALAAIDIYFPIGTILELVFYVGLLKVSVKLWCQSYNENIEKYLIF